MYTIKLLDSAAGSFASAAVALNSHGHAVGRVQFDGLVEPFRPMLWNPNPTQFSFSGEATGINDSGDVVGFSEEFTRAFLIRKDSKKPDLLTKFPDDGSSFARDINNKGLITGMFGHLLGGHQDLRAFIYDPNTPIAPTDLGVLPGHKFSQGFAINNKGQVTGLSQSGNHEGSNKNAFFYDGAMMDLGPAETANDLNDKGQVVGARIVNGVRTAFLCDTSSGVPQFEDIHNVQINGINNNGDIVGSGQGGAFVRLVDGAEQNLNFLIPNNSGWVLDSAARINDKGQIVGFGRYKGSQRAYLLPGSRLSAPHIDLAEIISLLRWWLAVWFGPGRPVVPIYPPPPFQGLAALLSPEKQEMLIGIVLSEFASITLDGKSRDELEKCALDMIRRAVNQLTGTYVPGE